MVKVLSGLLATPASITRSGAPKLCQESRRLRDVSARACLALVVGGLLLASCGHQPLRPLSGRYVSLGSSFAAGTALGGLKTGTPQRCGRSSANYATLLANRLGLDLIDVACGGATTSHVLGAWNELPPQIEAVTPQTRLITITIGGNDLRYVFNLAAASCDPAKGISYGGRTLPCPAINEPGDIDYERTEDGLRRIAKAVKQRAPAARLIFIQYVRLVPDTACPALNLSPSSAAITRLIGQRLAELTARAAKAEGAEVLAADQLSAQHTPCSKRPWSAGPQPTSPDGNAPWHPTRAGHAAIADALARLVRHR